MPSGQTRGTNPYPTYQFLAQQHATVRHQMLSLREPPWSFLKLYHGSQNTQGPPGPAEQAHSASCQVRAFSCHKQDTRLSLA